MFDRIIPPANAQRVRCAEDLPQTRSPAKYEVRMGGETKTLVLHKRRRQVLELLMRNPVYCASPVRLSDIVMVLKRDNGLDVETLTFPGDPKLGIGDFGIYILRSHVLRADTAEA